MNGGPRTENGRRARTEVELKLTTADKNKTPLLKSFEVAYRCDP